MIAPDIVPATSIAPARVAVLDDDIRFIRLVERILRTEHIEVQPITTPDVDEAVGVIAAAGCDAAIVDVYMYGSALGFALIERLRERPATAGLPIVVTSGARREIVRRIGFLRKHRCAVLLKPFQIEDLLAKLRDAPPRAPAVVDQSPPPRPAGTPQSLAGCG